MSSKALLGAIAVIVGLVGCIAWVAQTRFSQTGWSRETRRELVGSSRPVEVAGAPTVSSRPLASAEPALVTPPTTITPHTASSLPDEASFMGQIRDLVETDPELALRLAREGDVRYLNGKDGAERGWIICKALTNLRRFDEARAEAKIMVKKYPGTSFAGDITRHILINPGTHPSERGYGKELELE